MEAMIEITIIHRHPSRPPSGRTSHFPNLTLAQRSGVAALMSDNTDPGSV